MYNIYRDMTYNLPQCHSSASKMKDSLNEERIGLNFQHNKIFIFISTLFASKMIKLTEFANDQNILKLSYLCQSILRKQTNIIYQKNLHFLNQYLKMRHLETQDDESNLKCKLHNQFINHIRVGKIQQKNQDRLGCWQCLEVQGEVIFWKAAKQQYEKYQTERNEMMACGYLDDVTQLRNNLTELNNELKNEKCCTLMTKIITSLNEGTKDLKYFNTFENCTPEELQSFAEFLSGNDGEKKIKKEMEANNGKKQYQQMIKQLEDKISQAFEELGSLVEKIENVRQLLQNKFNIKKNEPLSQEMQESLFEKNKSQNRSLTINQNELVKIKCKNPQHSNNQIVQIDLGDDVKTRVACQQCSTKKSFKLVEILNKYKAEYEAQHQSQFSEVLKIASDFQKHYKAIDQQLNEDQQYFLTVKDEFSKVCDEIERSLKLCYNIENESQIQQFAEKIYQIDQKQPMQINEALRQLKNVFYFFQEFVNRNKKSNEKTITLIEKANNFLNQEQKILRINQAIIFAQNIDSNSNFYLIDDFELNLVLVGNEIVKFFFFNNNNQVIQKKLKVDFEITSYSYWPSKNLFALSSKQSITVYQISDKKEITPKKTQKFQNDEKIIKILVYSQGENNYYVQVLENQFRIMNLQNFQISQYKNENQNDESFYIAKQDKDYLIFGVQKKNKINSIEYLLIYEVISFTNNNKKIEKKIDNPEKKDLLLDFQFFQTDKNAKTQNKQLILLLFYKEYIQLIIIQKDQHQQYGKLLINQFRKLFLFQSDFFYTLDLESLRLYYLKLVNNEPQITIKKFKLPENLLQVVQQQNKDQQKCNYIQISDKMKYLGFTNNQELKILSFEEWPEETSIEQIQKIQKI